MALDVEYATYQSICQTHSDVVSVTRLGESLNNLLDTLEELGLEDIPFGLECDLRSVMNLPQVSSSQLVSKFLEFQDVEENDDYQEIVDIKEEMNNLIGDDSGKCLVLFRSVPLVQ